MLRFGWLVIAFFFLSCKKDSKVPLPVTERNAVLKVSVRKSYSDTSGLQTDSALIHALVIIYQTEEDRANNMNAEHSGTTDANGLVVFSSLEKSYYYLAVSYPAFGTKYDETSTPDNAIALEEIVF